MTGSQEVATGALGSSTFTSGQIRGKRSGAVQLVLPTLHPPPSPVQKVPAATAAALAPRTAVVAEALSGVNACSTGKRPSP